MTFELFVRPHRNPFEGQPRFVRVREALKIVGVGRTKLYALIGDGRIKARKIDGATFVDLLSVSELFASAPNIVPAQHRTPDVTAQDLGLPDEPKPEPVPKPVHDPDLAGFGINAIGELLEPSHG
jgi:hypothetical protein